MRNNRRSLSCFSWWILVGLASALMAPVAGAETFVVTKESDDDGPCDVDDCALREAVLAANASPGVDMVILPSGTYQLTIPGPVDDLSLTGDLDILDDLVLLGNEQNPPTIVGDGEDRVIQISQSSVEISDVIVTGGSSFSSGGGIRATVSDVTIVDTMITGNSTTEDGGGIFFGIGNFLLVNVTLSGNSAGPNGFGGGLRTFGIIINPANVELINSTITGNSAFSGGGIFAMADSNVTLVNSTIADNTATFRGDAFANQFSGPPTFLNTLLVGECAILSQPPISNGGNIESPGDSCQLMHPDDRHSVADPGIGPLADNGGRTPTHALLPDSPAIDTAVEGDCPETDQRHRERPVDGDHDGVAACDVGAYERGLDPIAIPALGPAGLVALFLCLALSGLAVLRLPNRP